MSNNDFYIKRKTQEWLTFSHVLSDQELGFFGTVEALTHELGGYLSINGEVPTKKEEAEMFGKTLSYYSKLVNRLMLKGFLARNERGLLYSPRLLEELAQREKSRENGKKGGNPQLKKGKGGKPKGNRPDNLGDNSGVKTPVNPEDNSPLTVAVAVGMAPDSHPATTPDPESLKEARKGENGEKGKGKEARGVGRGIGGGERGTIPSSSPAPADYSADYVHWEEL